MITMKKVLSVMLVAVMLLTAAPLAGFMGFDWPTIGIDLTADAATSGYYTYSVADGEATITDVDSSISGDITIPSTLGGYPVTSIGNDAFEYFIGLASITIPDSVTSIGSYAFASCTGLASITFGDNSQLTSIGSFAFYDCDGLASITIPDSVTSIGSYAFYLCTGLASINIPDSVTSIGNGAFASCTGLASINIPDSVTSIGSSAFYGCDGLASITVEADNANYSSDEYGVLFNKDKTKLIQHPIGNTRTSYTIPDSVTSIGSSAFAWCTSLASITFGDNSQLTSIGDSAFYNCSALKTVTFGDNSQLTSIGDSAFYNCSALKTVTFGENSQLTNIGNYAFRYCSTLASITIPDSVTSIGSFAFYVCDGLASITIPDSVTIIGYHAFYYTAFYNDENNWENGVLYIGHHLINAKSSVSGDYTIKAGTKYIGDSAFRSCTSLASITIPDSVTSIGSSAFYGCTKLTDVYYTGSESDWQKISIGSNNTPLTNATIHYSDVYVDTSGTYGNLTWSLDDDGVLTISGTGAMPVDEYGSYPWKTYNEQIKSVVIEDGVTSISYYAFSDLENLTEVSIGKDVEKIDSSAFVDCQNLVAFDVDWENMYYSSSDGILYEKFMTTLVCYPAGKQDSEFTALLRTENIGNGAFYACKNLTSVTLTKNVKNIGNEAFAECSNLTTVEIPAAVTLIAFAAFENCTSLNDVYYAGSEEQWKNILIGGFNTCLINATIRFGQYVNTQGTTVEVKKTDLVIRPTSKLFSDITAGGMEGVTLTCGNITKTNTSEDIFFLLPFENASYDAVLRKDGYKDYLIPADVMSSWRFVEVGIGKETTPAYEHTAVLQIDTKDEKPYVSTVFAREDDASAYSEICGATLKVSAGKKYNIIISAGNTGSGTCEYIIEQNANHKISNKTGVFTDVDLFNKLIYGLDCYAYVKRSDGTCSDLVKINIDRQATALSENVNKFLSESTLNLLGKDFAKYTVPSEIPLFGDAEISFGAFQLPVGIEVDGGNIQISIGANIFKYGADLKQNSYYEYGEWKGKWFSDWKDVVDGVTVEAAIDKAIDKNTDAKSKYDKARDSFFKKLLGVEDPSMKKKSKNFNVTGLGYIDATIINGQIVVKEACLSIEGSFAFKYSQQGAVWVIPAYVYVEAGASIGGAATGSRVVADNEVPFQWEWTLKINPKIGVGAGAGIKDYASLGVYANATMPVVFNFTKDVVTVDVTGEFGVEAQFCVLIKAKKGLIDGTVHLLEHSWAVKNEKLLRLPAYAKNPLSVDDVGMPQNTAQTEIVNRDYLSETSAWLGGAKNVRRVGASTRALQQDGLVLSDLQTSVFEKAEPQVVAFGDKLLMTWVEDDETRDELNRMRLMYSIYDGAVWSQPAEVYDDGCNDTTPVIATDGTDVYFIWQKIASVVTEETATIEHLVENTEIYTAVYDSTSGSITEVARRTDNNCFDYAQSVTVTDGEVVYYWATCHDNQMSTSMDNAIYRAGSDEAVVTHLPYVLSIAAEGNELSYVTDVDGDLTTVADVNVFTVDDSTVTAFDKQGNEVAHNAAMYGTIDNESVLFVSDGCNIYYEHNGAIVSVLNTDTTVNGLQFAEKYGTEYLFWTQTEEIGNSVYAVTYVDGAWTNPVCVSNTQSLLTCIDIAVLNNTLYGVCTSTEVIFNEEDETTAKGATNLCWFRINEVHDLAITDIYIDEKELTIGAENEFSVYVVNNGTQTVENLTFTITDGLGNETTIEKQVTLQAGCGDFVDLTYSVPDNFTTTTLIVLVDSADITDTNLANNSREKQIGKPQMVLTEAETIVIDEKYLVTAMLTNESDVTAENVAMVIHAGDENSKFYAYSVEKIEARETVFVEFVVDESDLLFDENGIAKIYMQIEDTDQYKGDQLVYVFAMREETECAHPVTEVINAVEPGKTQAGYTGDTICAGCSAVLQTGEEIPYVAFSPGDVNGDGYMTPEDARIVLRIAVELESPDDYGNADIDDNGIVTSSDARLLLRACVGLDILASSAPVASEQSPTPDASHSGTVTIDSDWSIQEIEGEDCIAVNVYLTDAVELTSFYLTLTYDECCFSYQGHDTGADASTVSASLKNSFAWFDNPYALGEIILGGYFREELWTADDFLASSDCVVNSDRFHVATIYFSIEDEATFSSGSLQFDIAGNFCFEDTVIGVEDSDYNPCCEPGSHWGGWGECVIGTIVCGRCGIEYEVYAESNDHIWDEGAVTIEPTCTETGVKTYVCKNNAEHTYTAEIPVLDHFDSDSDGLCDSCGKYLVADDCTLGDVDNDGQITSSDARLALRASVGLDVLTEQQTLAADVNKDGTITASDARGILRYAVGLDMFG